MNEKIGEVAGRSATIGLLLAVLLALLVAWGVMADDSAAGAGGELVQYKIDLAGKADRLEVALPSGFEYVALAPGSQVATEPEIASDGSRATWLGPFPGAEVLRFWLAPTGPAIAPATLPVAGASVEAVLAEPVTSPPAKRENGIPSGALVGTVAVTKTVDPEVLEREDSKWVTYEVIFTNSNSQPVVLDRITDTLPADFTFGNPALGDQAGPPVDDTEPDIVWENVTVPATGTLTVRYLVRASDRTGEFQNSVVALAGSEKIGPASATLRIEGNLVFLPTAMKGFQLPRPAWQITKTADPTEVEPGDEVQYTVQIQNTGTLTGTLGKIEDALPSEFTFLTMVIGGDITTPPSGTVGTLRWTGTWVLAPGESLTLIYRVKTGGGGDKVNTITIYDQDGRAVGTGSGTVTVGGGLPYEDNFDAAGSDGQPVDWQPFVNWPGLDAQRWFVGAGAYINDYSRIEPAWTSYDLSMYRAPGAESWTNYRIETRLKDSKEKNKQQGLVGVWLRGTYQDSGALDGKSVGGYYFFMKPSDDTLYLGRIKPDVASYRSYEVVGSYLYGPRIGHKHWYNVIIEVRGANIQVWFGDEQDGMVQAFNWTDPLNAWPNGTVGFGTYYTFAVYDYIKVLPLSE